MVAEAVATVVVAEEAEVIAEAAVIAEVGAILVAEAVVVGVGVDFRDVAHHIRQVEVAEAVPPVELRRLAAQI